MTTVGGQAVLEGVMMRGPKAPLEVPASGRADLSARPSEMNDRHAVHDAGV